MNSKKQAKPEQPLHKSGLQKIGHWSQLQNLKHLSLQLHFRGLRNMIYFLFLETNKVSLLIMVNLFVLLFDNLCYLSCLSTQARQINHSITAKTLLKKQGINIKSKQKQIRRWFPAVLGLNMQSQVLQECFFERWFFSWLLQIQTQTIRHENQRSKMASMVSVVLQNAFLTFEFGRRQWKGYTLILTIDCGFKFERNPGDLQTIDMLREVVEQQEVTRAEQDILLMRQYVGSKLPKETQHAKKLYKDAKDAETQDKNYRQAAQLYARAAREGFKYLTIVKDFASLLRKMGYLIVAIQFLAKAVPEKERDSGLLRLLQEMHKQAANPALSALKHSCTNLLIEFTLSEEDEEFPYLCQELQKHGEICFFYSDLGLEWEVMEGMGYAVLYFTAHSQARKAMMALKEIQYFCGRMYWMNRHQIVCKATGSYEDFYAFRVVDEITLYQQLKVRFNLSWDEAKEDTRITNILALGVLQDKGLTPAVFH